MPYMHRPRKCEGCDDLRHEDDEWIEVSHCIAAPADEVCPDCADRLEEQDEFERKLDAGDFLMDQMRDEGLA